MENSLSNICRNIQNNNPDMHYQDVTRKGIEVVKKILLIKNMLYEKGLYDDVINIIIDYTKPTLKEQCLDPKSLKRYAKHLQWRKEYEGMVIIERSSGIHN